MTNSKDLSIQDEYYLDRAKLRMELERKDEPTLLENLRYYKAGEIGERHIEAAIRTHYKAEREVAELHGRRAENQYWVDKYSREVKALDGWEDPLAKNRAKIARALHQDRIAELTTKEKVEHE